VLSSVIKGVERALRALGRESVTVLYVSCCALQCTT
jgi:phosphatidate phosphatase APP1